jgi:hypothetical protein
MGEGRVYFVIGAARPLSESRTGHQVENGTPAQRCIDAAARTQGVRHVARPTDAVAGDELVRRRHSGSSFSEHERGHRLKFGSGTRNVPSAEDGDGLLGAPRRTRRTRREALDDRADAPFPSATDVIGRFDGISSFGLDVITDQESRSRPSLIRFTG